jgi:hypothetical protein
VPAPPTEPPVAARAFGPLGSKLPEGPRNASNRRPTRQRAFNRAMRRLETIQTEAENRATCRIEISFEPSPRAVPTPPMTAAAMLILKSQDRVRFRSRGRCRLLSLRQLCFRPVSGSCRPKQRFVAGWFRDCALAFHIRCIRTFVSRGIPMCRIPSPFCGRERYRHGRLFVNQRKQIRNTNEHFAKSLRNMPQR